MEWNNLDTDNKENLLWKHHILYQIECTICEHFLDEEVKMKNHLHALLKAATRFFQNYLQWNVEDKEKLPRPK